MKVSWPWTGNRERKEDTMTFRFADIKGFIDKHRTEIGDETEMTLDRATEERKSGNGEIPDGSIAFIFQFDNNLTRKFFREHARKHA